MLQQQSVMAAVWGGFLVLGGGNNSVFGWRGIPSKVLLRLTLAKEGKLAKLGSSALATSNDERGPVSGREGHFKQ